MELNENRHLAVETFISECSIEFQEYKNKMLHFLLWQKLVETFFWLLLKIDCCFLQKSYLLHTKAQSLYSWFEKLTLQVHSKSQNN